MSKAYDVDHSKVILDKDLVKKRNEELKDYSKMFNNTRTGRGPGRGVYVGQKPKDVKGTLLRIWRYLGRYRYGVVIVSVATILTSALGMFIPLLFKQAIDLYIYQFDYDGALRIAIIIAIVAGLTSFVRFIARYLMAIISQKTVKKIRQDAFDKLQLLPVEYYDKNQTGDITSRLTNDIDLISSSLAIIAYELIVTLLTFVLAFGLMFYVNWALALFVVLFVPLMGYFTMKITKITRKGFKAQQKHLGSLNGIVEESISGIRVIKLYGQENHMISEFSNKNDELKKAGFKAQVYAGVIMPVINALNNIIYLFIIFLGGLLMITGSVVLTVGGIQAIASYARQMIQPIANLAQMYNQLQQGIAGAERVFTLIDTEDEYVNDGVIEKQKFVGEITFNDVTFSYNKETDVLKNIDFSVDKGQIIAIVGPTGSGKTTIINLLNRFYDVDKGSISIDGININEYKKDNLRKNVGVVLQDTNLFSGTVYDNIKYGDHHATKEEIEQAAMMANAHDFIMKLPHGYESEVYEGGQNFSQGERQLISIARTILSNPDVLILDEATSNVDTRTEFKIQESMRTLMENRTSFVIAHRLQTIRNADRILVIKDGELIERGNHKELLELGGFYYDLYTTQFKDLEKSIRTN